ncbi:MAG TPA: 5,6-dimethylbenzimidazole synthase [Acidisarcina sp.]|nr:5,6-dimethylbenzimidazole synthase [Acidisarcina sp.]
MKNFSSEERAGVYRAIRERRDVRSDFLPDPLPQDLLLRLLGAAHQAPSVGLMQPWRFLVIESRTIREEIFEIFQDASAQEHQTYSGEREQLYSRLTLQGILTAPVNLCVVCDSDSSRGHSLGRHTMPETALYSAVCAIQNLWLAARAEGVGVGWVSILHPERVKAVLKIPASMTLVGYFCMGFVKNFAPEPELEQAGWERRLNLEEVLRHETFNQAWSALQR